MPNKIELEIEFDPILREVKLKSEGNVIQLPVAILEQVASDVKAQYAQFLEENKADPILAELLKLIAEPSVEKTNPFAKTPRCSCPACLAEDAFAKASAGELH